jgi:hypothetical protein
MRGLLDGAGDEAEGGAVAPPQAAKNADPRTAVSAVARKTDTCSMQHTIPGLARENKPGFYVECVARCETCRVPPTPSVALFSALN